MTEETRDCLNCSASFSDDDDNGKMILRCAEHDWEVVSPDDCCDEWNWGERMTLIDTEEYEEEDYESDLKKELLAKDKLKLVKGELKPCPFCGADEVNLSVREDEDGESYVYCHVCDSVYYNDNQSQNIIDMWNRRARE